MSPDLLSSNSLGFSLPDIVGLGLGFMAAVLSLIALAAAVIIFFLGIRYSKHLSEIESARKELVALNSEIKQDIEKNASMLKEVHLGFGVIRELINLQAQEKIVESASHPIVDDELRERELKSIRRRIKARELEIQILAQEGKRCKASILGLAHSFGDISSVEFFREYADIQSDRGNPTQAYFETIGIIQGRTQLLQTRSASVRSRIFDPG